MPKLGRYIIGFAIVIFIGLGLVVAVAGLVVSLDKPVKALVGVPPTLAFIGVLVFALMKAISYLSRFDVALDDDGIWRIADGKQKSLVPWAEVAEVVERTLLQELEILDRQGQRRLAIPFMMPDYERLRSTLHNAAKHVDSAENNKPESTPQEEVTNPYGVYEKDTRFRLMLLCASVIGGLIGLWIALHYHALIGIPVAILLPLGFVISEALEPCRVEVDRDGVVVSSRLKRTWVPFDDVTGVGIEDSVHKRIRHSYVQLRTRDKPNGYKLFGIGPAPSRLYKILEQAWRNANHRGYSA